jgi:hypothetical protein
MEYDYIAKYATSIKDERLPYEVNECIISIKRQLGIYNEPMKSTVIVKADNKDIFKILNKLSKSNYDKLSKELFEEIVKITDFDEINKITNKIFYIASSNIFYSELFSTLYVELIKINSEFYKVFQENFMTYCEKISQIQYVSPNINYDLYCDYSKNITQLKASLTFFSNLTKAKVCSVSVITTLLNELVKLLEQEVCKEDKEYKQELLNSVYILITECFDMLLFEPEWQQLYLSLMELKSKNTDNKMKFKFMDIEDFIKKQGN